MSVSSFKSLAKSFVDNTFSDFTQTYTFQSLNKAPDGQGGFTSGWSTFATVTGFVKIDSGREGELDDHPCVKRPDSGAKPDARDQGDDHEARREAIKAVGQIAYGTGLSAVFACVGKIAFPIDQRARNCED